MKQSSPGLKQNNIVSAWQHQSTLLELYCYKPEKPEKMPAHCHAEYQFCLSVNYPSESYYQKSVHFVPAGSLSIVHPGEMHSGTGRDVGNQRDRATFRMMYMQPQTVMQIAGSLFQRMNGLPYFVEAILLDQNIAQLFLAFHLASQHKASALEQTERLQSFLSLLLQRYSEYRLAMESIGRERPAVRKVCSYLRERYAYDVKLEELAQVAELSPAYLSRVFKAEVGISLSHYQTQLRIAQARPLLLGGMPIQQIANDLGFTDQSHFSRAFKRFVHTTPGKYRSDIK